ncbi:hypothetical protein CUP1188 [Campylobacter upsaliensis RM3195]|nr:hypothetical protein CUP1188 [Campylobacter upsaliensis RM3195]
MTKATFNLSSLKNFKRANLAHFPSPKYPITRGFTPPPPPRVLSIFKPFKN